MAETVADRISTSTVEDTGVCRKRVTIRIPAGRVREKLSDSFDTVAKQATLPGFRPGRAPRRLVEKRFGRAARDETRRELASQAVREAVQEHGLRVLGDPEGGESLADADLSGESDLEFTFEVEVAPEVEIPDLSGVEILKPIIEITEARADEEIEKLCLNEGDLEEVAGDPQPGDYLVGHGVMTRDSDGAVVHDIEGAVVRIPQGGAGDGAGMALGVRFENLAEALAGKGVGDEVVLNTTGPDQHEIEAIRSEPITVRFSITAAHRIRPLSVDELSERLGMPDAQSLREAVMLRLNQRALIEQQAAMRQQLGRTLLEMIPLDLPEKVTAKQTERNIARRRMELMYRGVDEEEIDQQMDALRRSSEAAAINELKLYFILGAAAMARGTEVTEQEVLGRIAQLAAERGRRPDELRQELVKTGAINALAMQIREHKVLDQMLGEVKVTEVPLEEFNKRLAGGSPAPATTTKTSKKASSKGAAKKSSKKSSSKKKTSKK
ncbi:MAG: trigger factor [Planctomycetota bacterium]|nr:MAG: trigger factor [Planctomycetota bacterium]